MVEHHYSDLLRHESELNTIRTNRLRTSLEGTLNHRINSASVRLQSLEKKGAAPFAVRMAAAKLNRAESSKIERLSELDTTIDTKIETELIAAGILRVLPASS